MAEAREWADVLKSPEIGKRIVSQKGYRVYTREMEHLTASSYVLSPGEETVFGCDTIRDEIYYFLAGAGQMLLGGIRLNACQGTIVFVDNGVTHQVINIGTEDLKFLCISAEETRG